MHFSCSTQFSRIILAMDRKGNLMERVPLKLCIMITITLKKNTIYFSRPLMFWSSRVRQKRKIGLTHENLYDVLLDTIFPQPAPEVSCMKRNVDFEALRDKQKVAHIVNDQEPWQDISRSTKRDLRNESSWTELIISPEDWVTIGSVSFQPLTRRCPRCPSGGIVLSVLLFVFFWVSYWLI